MFSQDFFATAVHLIPEHADWTRRGHFRRTEPHSRYPRRQVQYENLRTGHDSLADHGHEEPLRVGGRHLNPGTDHSAERASHHGHAETLQISHIITFTTQKRCWVMSFGFERLFGFLFFSFCFARHDFVYIVIILSLYTHII